MVQNIIQVAICCSVIPRFRELKRGRKHAQVTLTLRKVGQKGTTSTKQNVCFICEEFDERKKLHQVEFVKTCVKLKEMANSVNDNRLMATLNGPDAIALELKYHTKCYIDLSNRLRSASVMYKITRKRCQITAQPMLWHSHN